MPKTLPVSVLLDRYKAFTCRLSQQYRVIFYFIHGFELRISLAVALCVQELCYYAIFTLFYFIAGVVSAVNGYRDGAVVAAAVSI